MLRPAVTDAGLRPGEECTGPLHPVAAFGHHPSLVDNPVHCGTGVTPVEEVENAHIPVRRPPTRPYCEVCHQTTVNDTPFSLAIDTTDPI